jgi:hypothetical protein
MSNESKSAYELRMDMLSMSKEILERQFEINKEFAIRSWELAVEAAREAQKAVPPMPEIPKYPSLDEIMAMATKMNGFVSSK